MDHQLGNQLLHSIYGCSHEADRWQNVLDQICTEVGARNAAVQLFRRDGSQLVQQWCARDSYSAAHAEQHDSWVNNSRNPRLNLGNARIPVSQVVTDRDRFANGSAELQDLQKRLARVGLRGGTGLMVEVAPSQYFSLILHRTLDDPDGADVDDANLLAMLAPHLCQAGTIAVKLEQAQRRETVMASLTDRLQAGIIMCARDGKMLWCNPSAEHILENSSTMAMAHGRLICSGLTDQTALKNLLSTDSSSPSYPTANIGHQSDEAIQLVALPAGSTREAAHSWTSDEDAIILLLQDQHHRPAFCVEATAALFNLTPAEARLAIALCLGSSISEYALERGISLGTARIQLKQAMAKTGTHRQGALIGKVYGSIIAQAASRGH